MAFPIVSFSSVDTFSYKLRLEMDLWPVIDMIWLSEKFAHFRKVAAITLMEWFV